MQTGDLDARLNEYLATYPGIRLNRIQRLKNGEIISYFGDLTLEQREYLKNRAVELDSTIAGSVAAPIIPVSTLNTQELDEKLANYLNIFPKIRQDRIRRIMAGEDIMAFGSLDAEQKSYLKSKLASVAAAAAEKRKSPSPDPSGKRLRPGLAPAPATDVSGKQSRVYLFDAHANHRREVLGSCSQIRWFRPSIPANEQVPFNTMVDQSFNNPYFRFLQSRLSADELKSFYDPKRGLSLDDDFWSARIAELQQTQNPTVLLGWNGAITKFEDLPLMPDVNNVQAELEFLVGGPSRLNSLRLLIGRLQDDGIKVVIVTDAESCGSAHFVSLLFQFSNNLEWICTGGQSKGEVLAGRPEFADVCEPQERIRHGIFFDNAAESLDDVRRYCKQIQFVKVPDSGGKVKSLSFEDPAFQVVLREIGSRNLYFISLRNTGAQGDRFDTKSGLRPQHEAVLQKWLASTENVAQEGRAVLLDWDRTLTVIEGYHNLMSWGAVQRLIASGKLQASRVIEDTLRYLMGGTTRLKWLRDMIDSIPTDVELVVLTNNKSCLDAEHKKFFKQLLSSLFNGRRYSLICGADFDFDKGAALSASAMFREICTKPTDEIPSHTQQELDSMLDEFVAAFAAGSPSEYFDSKMKELSQSDYDYILNQLDIRTKKAQEKAAAQTPTDQEQDQLIEALAQQEQLLAVQQEPEPVVVVEEEPVKAKKRRQSSKPRSRSRSPSISESRSPTRSPSVGPTIW